MLKIGAMGLAVVFIVVFVAGCTTGEDDVLYIDYGSIVPNDVCYASGLKDKVVVFYTTSCPVCKVTVPRLQLLEAKLNTTFEYIMLDTEDGASRTQELKIVPYHVPTVLINCVAYGSKTQDEYEELIKNL